MKKKKARFNKILNILSTKQLIAIYNMLKNISAKIDIILGNRCMKKIQPLLDEGRFKEALTEINLFFGPKSGNTVAKYLCIFSLSDAEKKQKENKE